MQRYLLPCAILLWKDVSQQNLSGGIGLRFPGRLGIVNGFYVAFHKVITFGTGSIVAMMVHLKRYGVPPETSYGLGTTQYVMHRIAVTLYATVCILLEHDFFMTYFEKYRIFIYVSYGVTVAVSLCLLGICLSRRIHRLILGLLRRLGIQRRYPGFTSALEDKMTVLQHQTALLLQSKGRLCRVFLLEMLKLSCWFVIPYLALWGTGSLNGLSFPQAVSVIAIVTVLIGVIPTPGNIASIELIYTLLFTVVVGEVAAGSTMLLYRFATFYLPFLAGMAVTFWLRVRDIRRGK